MSEYYHQRNGDGYKQTSNQSSIESSSTVN